MSAYDPYSPKTKVGPHRVFVDPPPDPASEVPGHPDELLAWLREPGDNGAERARRVDLAEEVEMGRPGRMRDIVLDAIRWNREVITEELDDGDDSWASFEKTVTGPPPPDPVIEPVPDGIDEPDTIDATTAEAPADPSVTDSTEADAADEQPAPVYTAADVPGNARDVVTWIQAAPDEADAVERSQAAWLVEIDRSTGVRSTVRAEIDKHLD